MSQDQKPPRVRVMQGGEQDSETQAPGTAPAAVAAPGAAPGKAKKGGGLMLALLFVLASAGGGVALELLVPPT